MSIRRDAKADRYDAVVIGSGLGGLTAGALLANQGMSVLVVERHDRLGGYAHAFLRGRYRFDSAVHLVAGGPAEGASQYGVLSVLLEQLGIADRCEFVKLEPFYRAVFPGFELDVSTGPDFLDGHAAAFPHERAGLRKVLRLGTLLTREVMTVPADLPSTDLEDYPVPLMREYRNATVADVFDAHLTDERLKSVLATLWPYMGVPPSRAAFDMWAPMLANYVDQGVYYCRGGFQKLVDAFAAAIVERGGELLTHTTVSRILTRNGRVTGVRLDNGQELSTPVVLSNADPVQTSELVDDQALCGGLPSTPGYADRVRAMRPSLSSAVLFLAVDGDLEAEGVPHETFVFDHWDHDESYLRALSGEVPMLAVTVPTHSDRTLARDGRHLVTVSCLLPGGDMAAWRTRKPHYEKLLLEKLERVIPDAARRVVFQESGTPRTMERYTLNRAGAIYGWEQTPDQSTTDRLPHRTPVEGLVLSGHWTQPGAGVLAVLASGIQAAEIVAGAPVFAAPGPRRPAISEAMTHA